MALGTRHAQGFRLNALTSDLRLAGHAASREADLISPDCAAFVVRRPWERSERRGLKPAATRANYGET